MPNTARNHRDNVFCMLYRDRKNLLSLYNAVNGTDYQNEEEQPAEKFFTEHRKEVIEMGIFEYDAELHDQVLREESRLEGKAEGKVEGKAEDVLELLEELAAVPAKLREEILSQKDIAILKTWLKAAARAESLEEWEKLRK